MQRGRNDVGIKLVIDKNTDDEDFHIDADDMKECLSIDNMGSNRISQRFHQRNFTLGKNPITAFSKVDHNKG